ncbi:hypothetical protein [Streptomyces sp. Ac-502]|uniref:hypothetical protein n=1 Tax=Streptomyces sp. Ac-502 TaxID=3342801 RepID=UPI0038627DF2
MPKETAPDHDRSVRPADLERADAWPAHHGLPDDRPTPLPATRLAARRDARPAADVLLAAFLIAVSLSHTVYRPDGDAVDGPGPPRHWSLLAPTAVVAGLVLAQSLLDRRVRQADRRAAATLPRRAAHPVRLG